ncbi:hypothetical protein VST7929_01573 [Vibrio stylophorae]|uniref:Uncharacterized protein n=1 Tax=Vibrio stylophorae TaxID=659351 RepID=A0ABM8ZTQ5_9VIBR|nr:DUF6694 family lipoprotein [Vibrio stylophorae]CAH0533698.1 hypothetical protein VST7929_01573 [Vibrio stylophorae]
MLKYPQWILAISFVFSLIGCGENTPTIDSQNETTYQESMRMVMESLTTEPETLLQFQATMSEIAIQLSKPVLRGEITEQEQGERLVQALDGKSAQYVIENKDEIIQSILMN